MKQREDGFTLIELLVVIILVTVLAAIVSTHTMRARAAAYQSSAVASLREINSGQASYSASCAAGGYATDLADLARPPAPGGIAFVGPDLALNGAEKSGYVFALVRSGAAGTVQVTTTTCNASLAMPASAYQASGNPRNPSAGRFLATDQGGTIYMNTAAVANPIPADAEGFR
jgi:prepilin-type N-terminal cleavage/methylation domain-containing protein